MISTREEFIEEISKQVRLDILALVISVLEAMQNLMQVQFSDER